MKCKLISMTFICLVLCLSVIPANSMAASSLKQGSQGNEVTDLQSRLKHLGYFNSNVTGYYGWITQDAVGRFQKNYGLAQVDGIAGQKTWDKIYSATKGFKATAQSTVTIPKASFGLSSNEINELEKIAYAEARGEGHLGMVAVTSVLLNRLRTPEFPNTIAGIIYEPSAFECVANGEFHRAKPNQSTKKAVQDALNGWDPTNGSVYFFNPVGVTNKWVWNNLTVVKKIGKHMFCKKK